MTDEKWQRTRQRLNFFICARESEVSARVTKRNSKKMETFAFKIFFSPLFLSFWVNFYLLGPAATAINCRKSTSSYSSLISSHSTSDDICKFRFRLSYFLLCVIKYYVFERALRYGGKSQQHAVWMSECCEIFWQTIAMYSVCCFGVPVPDFHSFFLFHFHPAEIVCLK